MLYDRDRSKLPCSCTIYDDMAQVLILVLLSDQCRLLCFIAIIVGHHRKCTHH